MTNVEKARITRPAGVRARLFAFTALGALVGSVAYVGQQGYLAATDSFVAPIILSPDNDQVLATKVHATQLAADRARAAAEIQAIDETLAAGAKALERLQVLVRTPKSSLAWTSDVTARQVSAGAVDEKMLVAQHAVLTDMISKQEHIVREGSANLEAGLISKTEYTKELQTQNELRLAILENERTHLQTTVQRHQANLTQRSLSGNAPPTPELMMREEQLVRVELEILRLESEQRSKAAEKKTLQEKLATLDAIDGQLKARPIVRATEKSLDVAFVPYTQIEGVRPGATVYDCIWGAFHCKAVGTVAELVPGEVILPDPWGNQARGQYAILTLQHRASAKAKTLRIRGRDLAPETESPAGTAERVSVK